MKNLIARLRKKQSNSDGFTYPEVIITISILFTILGVVTINLLNVRNNTSLNTVSDLLIADVQNQQNKALSNNTEGRSNASDYGIRIQNDRYILFHGTYNSNEPSNVMISIEDPLTLTTTFPNSQVSFTEGLGEVDGFITNQNTITLTDTSSSRSKTIHINRLGIITQVN